MSTKILSTYHRIVVLEKDETRYLGVQLIESRKARELSIFAGLKNEHGWILSEDRFEMWPITGFLEADGKVCFYGPHAEGVLLSSLLDDPHSDHLTYLQRLAAALTVLQEHQRGISKMYTNGVLFLDDGRILFLPWKIMEELDRVIEKGDHLTCYEQLNHPEKGGAENIAFSLAVMVYRAITKQFPFTGDDEEEIHEQIRERYLLAPKLNNPEIRQDISDAIMTTLGKKPGTPLKLGEWESRIEEWQVDGTTETVSQETREALEQEAARQTEKGDKQQQRRNFFHRNRLTLTITAVAAAAAIWLGTSVLTNVLKPPVTVGRDPGEVVQIFYDSINNLDSETVGDCLDRNVEVAELNEILNLFVVSKVRTAYEGSSGLIPASNWIARGKPPLNSDEYVYGITSVEVSREREDRYLVTYEKWTTYREEESAAADIPKVQGTYYEKRLFMRDTGKYWVISGIEDLTEEEIAD